MFAWDRHPKTSQEGENKPRSTWSSTRTELWEVLGPLPLGNAVHLYITRPQSAWIHSELGLAWSRGFTRALQTQFPTPMFLEYCDASMSLSQDRLIQWSPVGHCRCPPFHLISKEAWDATRAALPTQHKLPPPALANTRFSKCLEFSLRRKGVFKDFPNYIDAFVILRYFHFPLFHLTLLPDARGMHFPLY